MPLEERNMEREAEYGYFNVDWGLFEIDGVF